MNTSTENSKSNLITIKNRKYNKNVDFIAKYDSGKCIGIYMSNMYPLLISKNDEEFLIVADENSNYIIKVVNESIKAVYSSNAKKLLEANEKQSIMLIPQESDKFFVQNLRKKTSLIIERLNNTLILAIYEEGKETLLFNISKNEYILKSSYIDTLFFQNDEYFFEKYNNKIKAIYNIDGKLALKSNEYSLRIVEKIYAEEIYHDGKCHSIYVKPKYSSEFKRIITDYIFDLSILNIGWSFTPKNILILRKIDEKCKALFLYDFETQTLTPSNILDSNNEYDKYFEVLLGNTRNSFLVKTMINDKCIELINSNFKSIISLDEDEICNTSLEVISFDKKPFIKKMYNGKCIAVYDILGNICSKAENKDIDIVLFKGYESILFMHKLDDKYIKIEGDNISTISNFVFEPFLKNNEVIAVYGIKDGKRVAIYNFKLKKVVSYEDFEDVSLRIAFSSISKIAIPLRFGENIVKYQNIIFLKYDSDDKCKNVYNEKNTLLLEAKNNHHFIISNDYILEYDYEKCVAIFAYNNEKLEKVLEISSHNHELLFYNTSKGSIFIEEYDYVTKMKVALYQKHHMGFCKILSKYYHIVDWHNYIIILNNDLNVLQLLKIDYENSKSIILYPTHNGMLKIATDSLNQIYAYELNENEKIIAIYYLDDDKFVETITSDSGIEIVKQDNFDFFKTNGKLYNLLGYEI